MQAPNIDEKVDLHFIALVHVDGHLYELGKNFKNLLWGEKLEMKKSVFMINRIVDIYYLLKLIDYLIALNWHK